MSTKVKKVSFVVDEVTNAAEALEHFEFKATKYKIKHFNGRTDKGVSYCRINVDSNCIDRVSFHEYGADIYYSSLSELPDLLKGAVVVKPGTFEKKKELLKKLSQKECSIDTN